jgi:shikimate dehydrogenase
VVAVLGYPVEHSRSPAMHNAAFDAMGLDYRYLAFAVPPPALRDAVRGLRALGIVGANVTIPLKERIIPYLDDVSDEARIIGAVNTIVIRSGRLIGHNTDAQGFLRSLREDTGVTAKGGRFLIVGAGGAARAVAAGLAMSGARGVVVVNRSVQRALGMARRFRRLFPAVEWIGRPLDALPAAGTVRAVIQCTSVGMRPEDPSPIPVRWLEPRVAVYDLIYHTRTALVREARAVGAPSAGGLGMLVHQGARAFALWTGRRPPIDVMRRALVHSLEKE